LPTSAKAGLSCQRPTTQARQRNEQEIARWRKVRWPQLKKSPPGEAHPGFHRRKRIEPEAAPGPHLGPTRPDPGLAVRLQLEKTLGHRRVTVWNFYFRLYLAPSKARSGRIPRTSATAHRGQLLVIWDGGPIHRSRLVRDYLDNLKGKIGWKGCPPMRLNSIPPSMSGLLQATRVAQSLCH